MLDSEIVKYKIGAVVKRKEDDDPFSNQYGHVIGFSRNDDNELVINVKYEGGVNWTGFATHPTKLEIL